MKTNPSLRLAVATLIVLVVLPARGNTTATWTNNAGGNAWETAGNWDINQVPNNFTFDVTIGVAAPCNYSSGFAINSLTLSSTSANLNLNAGSVLSIDGATGIDNAGTIVVDTTAGNTLTDLFFNPTLRTSQITGSGSIQLNGPGLNVAYLEVAGGATLTHDANHTIHGRGIIYINATNGGALLINNGVINADFNGDGIALDVFGGFQNNGILEGTNGGDMDFDVGVTIDQTGGGTFLADGAGSIVQLGRNDFSTQVTVLGGTLNTTKGGMVKCYQAFLAGTNITNSGDFEIVSNGFAQINAATLTNDGTITLDSSGSRLYEGATTTITGSGAIVLTNGAVMELIGGTSATNDSGHTIEGNGTIQLDGTNGGSVLTNNGIIAPGLSLSPGQLNINGSNASVQLGSTSQLAFEIGGTIPVTDYDVLSRLAAGTQTLGGNLVVSLINNFLPASTDTFIIFTTQATLQGAFSNVASGGRLTTEGGEGSFIVNYSGMNNVTLSNFLSQSPTPTPTPTATPCTGRCTPTPRPRPTPHPRPGTHASIPAQRREH